METDNTLSLTRIYEAPIDLLWQVITEREHLKQWYFDFAEDWQLKTGSQFDWVSPDDECKDWLHRGVMLEIIENKKLSHSWEYPGFKGYSVVTWELIEIDTNTTELRFTHFFKVPFESTENALRRENFAKGWNFIINTNLAEYLDKVK